MFAFKVWGDFACFRDPLTISQNITFPIPPKTAVGGMVAAILGLECNEWMGDDGYFDFKYSVVPLNPIRKKSFVQNYINDYTKQTEAKLNKLAELSGKNDEVARLIRLVNELDTKGAISKKEQQKKDKADKNIIKLQNDIQKSESELQGGLRPNSPQKQVSRELLLNPKYLIVIDDFKYEQELVKMLKNHESKFTFYLGNSEFLGNFEFLGENFDIAKTDTIHSFTTDLENIDFMQPNKKYTNIRIATKTIADRQYRDYKNFVVCGAKDSEIKLKEQVKAIKIELEGKEYYCELA